MFAPLKANVLPSGGGNYINVASIQFNNARLTFNQNGMGNNGMSTTRPFYQFYDTAMYSSPPSDPSHYEYEPISQFFLGPNYSLNNTNNLPTRPSPRIRRLNILRAKRDAAISDAPMSIAQALCH